MSDQIKYPLALAVYYIALAACLYGATMGVKTVAAWMERYPPHIAAVPDR